jgi:hypothetical protein
MKKALVFWIALVVIGILLIVTFLYNLIYFNAFKNNMRQINDEEKAEVVKILNETVNVGDYSLKYGNVLSTKQRELVPVELIKGNSKKHYLVDLRSRAIIKK